MAVRHVLRGHLHHGVVSARIADARVASLLVVSRGHVVVAVDVAIVPNGRFRMPAVRRRHVVVVVGRALIVLRKRTYF